MTSPNLSCSAAHPRWGAAAFFLWFLTGLAVASAQTGGWMSTDIGPVGIAGSDSESAGVVTVRGAGTDIWERADGFHFRSQPVTGDITIIARVTDTGGGHPWAKAGLMMREDLTPGARNVMLLLSPGNSLGLQVRSAVDDNTTYAEQTWTGAPVWLMLARVGNIFRGYRSADGNRWVSAGSVTLTLPATLQIGLAVSSHDPATLQTATFDNVSLPATGSVPATPGMGISNVTHSGAHLYWTDNSEDEDHFEIYCTVGDRSRNDQLWASPAANVTSLDTGLAPNTMYTFYIRAVRGKVSSSPSTPITIITPENPDGPPAAPAHIAVYGYHDDYTLSVGWEDPTTDETGFEIERAIGNGPFAVIATAPASPYVDGNVGYSTTYSYRVRTVRNGLYSSYSPVGTATTIAAPLPSMWTGRDINTGSTGSDSGRPPTLTMNAGGADIFGQFDGFHYMFETWSGDGTIVARVASLTNTHPWAKAGVMFRATLSPFSPNAAMLLTADNTCTFQARAIWGYLASDPGTATSHQPGGYFNAPYWVKVTRAGDTFTGYISPDGNAWTLVGSQTVKMPGQVYVGVGASSHASAQTVASFDHVEVRADAPPPPPPPPPSEWTQQNLGTATGSFTAGAAMKVNATSGDIYDDNDSGVFVYKSWTGNGEFVTKVDALAKSHAWAKGGIMLRAALTTNAANALIALTPDLGVVLQTRDTAGGGSGTYAQNWTPGPGSWIKLVRGGGLLTGYWSLDGVTWYTLGSANDSLPATLYVGFAVSSHDPAVATNASFSNSSFR